MRAPEQETAFLFEIGLAYEAKGQKKEALDHYQRVQHRDANDRDVGERVRRLSPESKVVARAVP